MRFPKFFEHPIMEDVFKTPYGTFDYKLKVYTKNTLFSTGWGYNIYIKGKKITDKFLKNSYINQGKFEKVGQATFDDLDGREQTFMKESVVPGIKKHRDELKKIITGKKI